MVRALFPRSILSVLRRGRFGGGHKPVLFGFPFLTTHSATRTARIDAVYKGIYSGTKSEGRVNVPSSLSHSHRPASSV